MKQINLGILETGLPPPEYRDEHGSYPDMFKQLLSIAAKETANITLNFTYFHVLDGDIPTDPSQCDAWLITGSKFGVYEEHTWIPLLSNLINAAYVQDIPMVGICFGHQLIAQALGGKVVKSDKGWSLGVTQYQIDYQADWMPDKVQDFAIQAYHQDQVVELPKDTQVIAHSDFCPYAGLNFANKAISFQGHPEFDANYTQKLLTNRRDLKLLPFELSSQAINDINQPVQRSLVATWICHFLQQKLAH